MFTIRKIGRFQHYFYNEKLGSGQVLTDFVHADPSIPESAVDLARLQIGKKLRGTLHDIYTLPKFEEPGDIYTFISELEGEQGSRDHSEFKKGVIRDIILAYKFSIKYLEDEGYYIPNMGHIPSSAKDLMRIIKKGESFKNIRDTIGYCTLLKEILGFFRIIRCKNFKVDYENGTIDLRNKEFMREIIRIFSESPFSYDGPNAKRFSETSGEMRGVALIDGKKIELYAGFGVKSLYAMIEKMDGQEKYNLPEAFKDIHRMRIEVKDGDDALRITKLLYEKFGGGFSIENVGGLIPADKGLEFIRGYLEGDDNINLREEYTKVFSGGKQEEKKAYSEDRKELKLTKIGDTPIEIQIVLVDNTNESGYAHHDVYKIRRKIAAKIRRHGWIGANGINTIIDMVFEDNKKKNKGVCTIPFDKDTILKHVMDLKGFLIGIRGESEHTNNEKKGGKIRISHYTTREVMEKYQENYPEATKKDPFYMKSIDSNTGVEGLIPISKISFPSKPETSSKTPSQDRGFSMDDSTREGLNVILHAVKGQAKPSL